MSETDENFQVTEGKDYTAQIKSQQEEWDALGEDGQEKFMEQKEAIEAEDADDEESAAIIKEHLIQHNENKKNPAYLVRGAELMCSQGSNKRMMNLSPCHGVYIKAHAVVHELDCIQGDEENITWFGVCTPGEELETEQIQLIGDDGKKCHGKKCKPHILGTWMESYDQTKIVDNGNKLPKEDGEIEGCNTLTMDSFLVCKHGGIIMPINSGQDREVGAEEFDYATEEERVEALNRVQKGCTGEEEEMDCKDLLYMKLENQADQNVHGSEYDVEKPDTPLYKDIERKVNDITQIDESFQDERDKFAEVYLRNKEIYENIANKAGVPPELIAVLHYRENSKDYLQETFNVYLHNGEKLGEITTMVPEDKFFVDFHEAAVDAIKMKENYIEKYQLTPTSKDIIAMMAFAEVYNGLGYYNNGNISPYLYSGTNIYISGKFEADGVYNEDLVDKQIGVYVLLDAIV